MATKPALLGVVSCDVGAGMESWQERVCLPELRQMSLILRTPTAFNLLAVLRRVNNM